MTYTFKLARRLAVSRDFAMLAALLLIAACSGDSTAPESKLPTSPSDIARFQVFPQSITIETGQRVQFRAQAQDSTDPPIPAAVAWEATGGTIDSTGTFWSSTPGTYRIIARRGRDALLDVDPIRHVSRKYIAERHGVALAMDTSVVEVVPISPQLKRVAITPKPVTMKIGATRTFSVTGFLSNNSAVAVGVTWSATGGAIDPAGTYTAGSSPGTYRVIALHASGALADTAAIVLRGSPASAPKGRELASAVLTPGQRIVAVRSKLQYHAYGRTKTGDSVGIAVAFSATGGTISPTGLYTAGSQPGTFHVMVRDSLSGLADTTQVFVASATVGGTNPLNPPLTTPVPTKPPVGPGKGVPFGAFAGQVGSVESVGGRVPFSLSMEPFEASNIVSRIKQAQASGMHLMIAMTSGKHDKYKTGGVFDMSKWLAKMNTYNTPAIKATIAAAVADGTIIGNSVMDEPHNTSTGNGNSWGPAGTMTKARVDEMCGYVKQMFPTLPVGVVHDHKVFEPTKSYRVCDFIVSQYAWRKTKGDIIKFRDDGLALARRDGIAIAFSMNLLGGGIPASELGGCPTSRTGGPGLDDGNCKVTAAQIREWGEALGAAGCAMLMWRYDPGFFSRPDNVQAFRDVTAALAKAPARSCRRP